jgi:hypothetical protein
MIFSDVVETIKNLSFEEKQELHTLLAQYIREERRNEIYQNYLDSKQEVEKGKLEFSSDINRLKELLEEE